MSNMKKLVFDLPTTNRDFRRTLKSEGFCSKDLNEIWDLDDNKAYRLTVYDEKPEVFDHEVTLKGITYHIDGVQSGLICSSVRGKNLEWMNHKVWVTMREEGFNE